MKQFKQNERAISPIIGTIIMVAITVITKLQKIIINEFRYSDRDKFKDIRLFAVSFYCGWALIAGLQ